MHTQLQSPILLRASDQATDYGANCVEGPLADVGDCTHVCLASDVDCVTGVAQRLIRRRQISPMFGVRLSEASLINYVIKELLS